ncbi:isoprenylcysteine carboxyl methyltransferase family protein [Ammoniphilus sp. YIM 78166]|uniref:isoprenylcysteine carboxyl methyltransferase family protein n=1 Tax=Ammoniphilus sp. YIM 78166 TaxID=1644106 RepID=UPI00106FB337|nr:isoprenylcysteine carboxylmethyltransferase family protein [Ammoniphilus sp. YIM 78166]
MPSFFLLLFSLLITQRLGELWLAKRNADWMLEQGGYEVGREHYKYIVLIHIGFLSSFLIEVLLFTTTPPAWWVLPFSLFLLAQGGRYWCIRSLGPYWNTRIYILPNSTLVKNGPYRWIKHPNYLIVMTELFVIPLIFGAWYTAFLWSGVNYAFLRLVRIPTEEQALAAYTTKSDGG